MDFESDYRVEDYIKPTKIRVPLINDERADILGNFEDEKAKKRKHKIDDIGSEENPFADIDEGESEIDDEIIDGEIDENESEEDEIESEEIEEMDEDKESDTIETASTQESFPQPTDTEVVDSNKEIPKKPKNQKKKKIAAVENGKSSTNLSDDQITALMKGANKKDRFVLYVTNLNYETSKEKLFEFFKAAGNVKCVRIPKNRKTAFAFVDMSDVQSYKNALTLHNQMLDEYKIKVQISEGGKKKSANKKNILKQKNRKLAEMRNEGKQFNRSGKGYNKTIKREIENNQKQQQRRLAKKQLKKTKK